MANGSQSVALYNAITIAHGYIQYTYRPIGAAKQALNECKRLVNSYALLVNNNIAHRSDTVGQSDGL